MGQKLIRFPLHDLARILFSPPRAATQEMTSSREKVTTFRQTFGGVGKGTPHEGVGGLHQEGELAVNGSDVDSVLEFTKMEWTTTRKELSWGCFFCLTR